MKPISTIAASIFAQLMDKLSDHEQIAILAGRNEPLWIQVFQYGLLLPEGTGSLLLFTQYEQEYKQTEMIFLVIDNRITPTDYTNLHIMPLQYSNEVFGIFQQSAIIDEAGVFTPDEENYDKHCKGAEIWLQRLYEQGFTDSSRTINAGT